MTYPNRSRFETLGQPVTTRPNPLGNAFAWPLALGLLVLPPSGCSISNSTAGAGAASEGTTAVNVPSEAEAHYSVTLDLGSSVADCTARYSEEGAIGTTSVRLTGGEVVTINGVTTETAEFGTLVYAADVPIVDSGDAYVFTLSLPDEAQIETAITTVGPAGFTVPEEGEALQAHGGLTISWQSVEGGTHDEVEVALEPNGDGSYVNETFGATDAGELLLSASSLEAMYAQAVGTSSGPVAGTLTLRRIREEAVGEPFTGGEIKIEAELARVNVTLQP